MGRSGAAARSILANGFARFSVSGEVARAVSSAFNASHRFFDLPLQEKLQNTLSRDLGYRPYGVEYSVSAEHPDQIESFSASHRISGTEVTLHAPLARALYQEAIGLFDLLEPLLEEIVIDLARVLAPNVDAAKFVGAMHSWSLLQLNRSCPLQIATDQISELHEDGCLLTLMAHDGPGLEFLDPNQALLAVTASPGEMLAIPGEILSLLSGGRIGPLFHRVNAHFSPPRRMALLLFADLDPALCKPWIRSEVNRGVDIGQRMRKNAQRYGLQEWKA